MVELLVVIIIIGILAGAAMLASGGGTASARAATIISNLRTLKSAALMYYADTGEWPRQGDYDADGNWHNDGLEGLFPYLDSNTIANDKDEEGYCNYRVYVVDTNDYSPYYGYTYVCYHAEVESRAVREKLASQAEKIGLLGNGLYGYDHPYTADDNVVSILVTRSGNTQVPPPGSPLEG